MVCEGGGGITYIQTVQGTGQDRTLWSPACSPRAWTFGLEVLFERNELITQAAGFQFRCYP